MGNENLISALRQIKVLVDESLKGAGRGATIKAKAKTSVSSGSKNLSGHIIRLREAGFFKQAKTAKEIHAKLQSTYACAVNRVAVALLRLKKRKQLRKTSKLVGNKEQIAYVW